jgi:5-formyltetrahydrofolate cyclo-ligase
MPAAKDQKLAVRRTVLAQRDALPAALRASLDARITQRLVDLPALADAGSLLAYLSFGSEFDTHGLLARLMTRGARIALPRVNRDTRGLDLYFVHDLAADTVSGTWGIREPAPDRCAPAALHSIDAVLAPGVAFTARGERLGYGGGFYDRLLGGWQPRPPVIAACYAVQLVRALPIESGDVPVDVVVTEDGAFGPAQ